MWVTPARVDLDAQKAVAELLSQPLEALRGSQQIAGEAEAEQGGAADSGPTTVEARANRSVRSRSIEKWAESGRAG